MDSFAVAVDYITRADLPELYGITPVLVFAGVYLFVCVTICATFYVVAKPGNLPKKFVAVAYFLPFLVIATAAGFFAYAKVEADTQYAARAEAREQALRTLRESPACPQVLSALRHDTRTLPPETYDLVVSRCGAGPGLATYDPQVTTTRDQ